MKARTFTLIQTFTTGQSSHELTAEEVAKAYPEFEPFLWAETVKIDIHVNDDRIEVYSN